MPLVPAREVAPLRYAMAFDGVDDFIRVPSSPSFKPSMAITISAWVNVRAITAWGKIVSLDYRANGSWFEPYVSYALNSSDGLSGRPYLDITVAGVRTALTSPDALELNTWYYITAVYDGTYMYLYVNNVLKATAAKTGPIDYGTSNDLVIGVRSPYNRGEYLNGLIAQVLIYNRALSNSEIMWNYRRPESPFLDGLVVQYHAFPPFIRDVDGDNIPDWEDLSSLGNHGKIMGATLFEAFKYPVRLARVVD